VKIVEEIIPNAAARPSHIVDLRRVPLDRVLADAETNALLTRVAQRRSGISPIAAFNSSV
jgi:hypothetical protein